MCSNSSDSILPVQHECDEKSENDLGYPNKSIRGKTRDEDHAILIRCTLPSIIEWLLCLWTRMTLTGKITSKSQIYDVLRLGFFLESTHRVLSGVSQKGHLRVSLMTLLTCTVAYRTGADAKQLATCLFVSVVC
jgi:hypothetical protein